MCFSIEFNKHSLNGEKKKQKQTGGSRKEEMRLLDNLNTIKLPVCFVVWVCCAFGIMVVVIFWFWHFFNKIVPLDYCAFGAH